MEIGAPTSDCWVIEVLERRLRIQARSDEMKVASSNKRDKSRGGLTEMSSGQRKVFLVYVKRVLWPVILLL